MNVSACARFVSLEQKRIDATKPYDSKTACWVPDEKEGYVQGKIIDASNDKTTKVALPSFEVSPAAGEAASFEVSPAAGGAARF